MKRLIGCVAVLCLLALTVGCGGVTSSGTLAYVSNSNGTGFTVFSVNTNGTLTTATGVSPVPSSTPAGDGPKVIQFSANEKWAYALDNSGGHIYAYLRSGSGTLSLNPSQPPYPFSSGGASSLVISPNSAFLYVARPNVANGNGTTSGYLSFFQILPDNGALGAEVRIPTYSITQLVMNSSGSLLFGLAPGANTVVSWTLNSITGTALQSATLSQGQQLDYMILSANGSYMYLLDEVAATQLSNGAPCVTPPVAGCSPNFYAYSVGTLGILQPISNQGASTVFNENADLVTGQFPTNPYAGVTTNDSRYLFIVNKGSANISVFKIATAANGIPGEPIEVPGTIINGTSISTASPFPCTGCAGPSFAAVSKSNNALYVLDESTGRIFQFSMNENSGLLRALTPAWVSAENSTSQPTWITIR
jgi:6-phosphogluconolactonase (cycloisomerase 2 family)